MNAASVASPRAVAAHTVDRILRAGAFSNVIVHETALDGRDRALHHHLVYQTLRWLRPADGVIGEHVDRPIDRVDPMVRSVLRTATVDHHVLGTEAYAAVDQAVGAVKQVGRGRASGFVNAVMRRITHASWEDDAVAAFEPWIVDRVPRYGATDQDLFDGLNEPAPVGVRIRGEEVPAGFIPVDGIPKSGYLGKEHAAIPDGVVDYVDPATTAVVRAMALEPGMRVLDIAAAPGGKTRAIADAVGPGGVVIAADIHRRRLEDARRRTPPPDVPAPISWLRMDGRAPALKPGQFDVVLLDAPCSGLGTVRRRPEIRHRLRPDTPVQYGRLQHDLVRAALPLVAPKGRLVYSVCTLFEEETVQVSESFGGRTPAGIPGHDTEFGVQLRPDLTGTDGMFIATID